MNKKIILSFLSILIFVSPFMSVAFAKDVTIKIDQDFDINVIGYRVYYQSGGPKFPLNGTEANEGPSPIDVGLSETATISGLQDDQVYYIRVTAYDAWDNESEPSNAISSGWVPKSVLPGPNDSLSPKRIDFAWETPPAEIVSYNLVYSTDASSLPPLLAGSYTNGAALLAGMSFMGLAGLGIRRKKVRRLLPLLLLCTILLVHGCGGDGGSDQLSPTSTGGAVTDLRTNTYTVENLQPSTTYHWKVVAVDAHGVELETPVYSFTTEKL
jgi:hypothetical protein